MCGVAIIDLLRHYGDEESTGSSLVGIVDFVYSNDRGRRFIPLPYFYHIESFSTTIILKYSVIGVEVLLQVKLYCLYSFIYRFRSDTKLRDEPAYYLMQVVCWCVLA